MMFDMFACFSIGIVVGMSITLFSVLIIKMHEADKELNKDERGDR